MNKSEISIKHADATDIGTIRNLALAIWPDTYKEILSPEQLTFMLDAFYSKNTLLQNISADNHQFILALLNDKPIGFAAFEVNYKYNTTKIHKLYIHPEAQGKGIGRLLLEEIKKSSLETQNSLLILNVNRFNKALSFYKKIGFSIIEEVNIEIGNGYLMEDYVMQKHLQNN